MGQYSVFQPEKEIIIMNPGNVDRSLLTLCDWLSKDEIIPPYFQREYVWEIESGKDKVRGWIESVLSQKAIGVIVTYQLPNGSTIFLADGLQRLNATLNFIRDPHSYGFDLTVEQAKNICEKYSITVQHRIYKTHDEAKKAFQNLNKGTSLTPAEFFKGELTKTKLGECAHLEIPEVMVRHTKRLIADRKQAREREHAHKRDSYSLFLRYITELKTFNTWKIAGNKIDTSKPSVESELALWIENRNHDEVKRAIDNFEKFIASQIAIIEAIRSKTGQKGKSFSSTLLRWLLHISIWRKNNNIPVSKYEHFVENVLLTQKRNRNLSSRIRVEKTKDEDVQYNVGLETLFLLKPISEILNCDLHIITSRKKGYGDIGLDNSHKIPVSQGGGDGETFYESASKNRSRGAQVVMNFDS